MDSIQMLLSLLLIIILFILLYAIIKFVFIERRSFTFEIITIPLGIFKFDKRDELIKKIKADKIESANSDNVDISIHNVETSLEEDSSNIDEDNTEISVSQHLEEDSNNDFSKESMETVVEEDVHSNSETSEHEDSLENIAKEIHQNHNPIIIEEDEEEPDGEDIVYWTATGKAYHVSKTCRTLARSKAIFSGTVEESGRYQKCNHCQ